MTQRDFILKWLLYTLAFLPILILGLYILPWFPIFGIIPTLLPVAAITVAVLEGPFGGAGFSLFIGLLSDALIPSELAGAMTLGLTLMGFMAGTVARYGVRQDFWGCLLCSASALGIIALFRILVSLLTGQGSFLSLLAVALPEIILSLVFFPLIYAMFRWVYNRVPQVSSVL